MRRRAEVGARRHTGHWAAMEKFAVSFALITVQNPDAHPTPTPCAARGGPAARALVSLGRGWRSCPPPQGRKNRRRALGQRAVTWLLGGLAAIFALLVLGVGLLSL